MGGWVSSPLITLENDETKYPLELESKTIVSHDTRKFRFKLPSENHVLGLPPGQCVYLSARINEKLIIRPYTPISCDEDKGYVELMIKVYFAGVDPKFPDGGKMSQHLDKMEIGEMIDFRGPSGLIVYHGLGSFAVKKNKKSEADMRKFDKISMVAGGSGITPMLQVISAVLRNPNDSTKIRLIFANRTEQDILLREELDRLSKEHCDRFKVWHTLSAATSEEWKYSKGYVNEHMFKEHLFESGENSVVLLCGPPKMVKEACLPNLEKLDHQSPNILLF